MWWAVVDGWPAQYQDPTHLTPDERAGLEYLLVDCSPTRARMSVSGLAQAIESLADALRSWHA